VRRLAYLLQLQRSLLSFCSRAAPAKLVAPSLVIRFCARNPRSLTVDTGVVRAFAPCVAPLSLKGTECLANAKKRWWLLATEWWEVGFGGGWWSSTSTRHVRL